MSVCDCRFALLCFVFVLFSFAICWCVFFWFGLLVLVVCVVSLLCVLPHPRCGVAGPRRAPPPQRSSQRVPPSAECPTPRRSLGFRV